MQGEMGSGKGDVVKERELTMIGGVLPKVADRSIGYRDCSVIAGASLHRRQFQIVLPMRLRTEKAALVLEVIGMLKAIPERHSVQMPFSGVITAIPCLAEEG